MVLLILISCTILNGQVSWHKSTGCDNIGTKVFSHYNNYYFAGTYNNGVFVSTNNGVSWNAANNGITVTSNLKTVNRFSQSGNKLFIATGHALGGDIYSSVNNGSTWTSTNFITGATDIVALDSVVCASTGSGTFIYSRSTDWGNSWKQTLFYTNFERSNYLSNYKKSGGTLYARSVLTGLVSSADHGTTWQSIGFTGIYFYDYFIRSEIIGIASVKGLYLSSSNGTNWLLGNNNGLLNDSINIRKFALANDTVFASSDTAVYFSILSGTSLSNWTRLNKSGLPTINKNHFISDIQYTNGVLLLGTYTFYPELLPPGENMGIWYYKNSTISASEQISVPDIKIYPIPAKDKIFIELSSFNYTSVEIIDVQGRLLQSIVLQYPKTQIDIANLRGGLYILRLKNGKGTTLKKIIKQD